MRNSWTAYEIDYVREHYTTQTYEQMAAVLSRTRGAVYAKMRELKLGKRPGFKRKSETDKPRIYGVGPVIAGRKDSYPYFRWQKCLVPAAENQKQPKQKKTVKK